MNYWAIICPESDLPGLWKRWQQENVATISFGSPQYLEEHPEMTAPMAGYGFARNRVKEMEPGDLIVPFLKDHRIARVAEFRRENVDEWRPVWRDDHGRRIEVVWHTEEMPAPDKVALIPPELRKAPIRRTVARLSVERFKELARVLADSETWQDLPLLQDDTEEEEAGDESRFALEKHLEEFMEANFQRINFGQRLELYQDDENTGRQFPTHIGSIDLLAKDQDSGEFVVIELKKGRSDDQVVGQILRYMGWVRQHMTEGDGSVGGIIVVPEPSERLKYALGLVPNVRLFTYSVSFSLKAVM